ncbi:MAG: PstS family phosphate ABC transporter substrate-binding protein [Nitrososphaerota archaeon]
MVSGSRNYRRTKLGAALNALSVALLVVGLLAGLATGFVMGGMGGGRVVTVERTVTATTVGGEQTPAQLKGKIVIDGSSTVYPLTEAAAEEFMKLHPGVQISVSISGTGGGFKRFVIGETDINDASRPILKSEAETAAKNGIEWIEIPVAIDGITIAVNPSNNWVDCITISELRRIWSPNSTITRWNQIRPEWPDAPIKLYGMGPDSGTFDYFTEHVVGKLKAIRTDYVASADPNVQVAGIEAEKYALGFFGYAYYYAAKDKIKALKVRDDALQNSSCVEPNDQTVSSFVYPLSRPLFIYVNKKAWSEKPELREFVLFYVENAPQLAKKVGYTPMPMDYYRIAAALLRAGMTDGLYGLTRVVLSNAGPH